MITEFKIVSNTDQIKEMLPIAIILNKNANFEKGVNKVLKMITNLNFGIMKFIKQGILSNENKFSLLRHMVKQIEAAKED